MKTLTDTQKKWALTATLSAVLSFNLVMSLTGANYTMTNLSSETESVKYDEFKINGKKVKVRYSKNDEGTTAIIGKETESGICFEKCGEHIPLPEKITSTKEALELAFRRVYDEDRKERKIEKRDEDDKSDKKVSKRTPRDDDDKSERKKPKKNELDLLLAECKEETGDERMECVSKGFSELLTDSDKQFNANQVMQVFGRGMQKEMLEALADNEDTDRQDRARTIISDLNFSIDKRYNVLRKELAKMSAFVVLRSYKEAQTTLKQSFDNRLGPAEQNQLRQEGWTQLSTSHQMAQRFDETLTDGIQGAAIVDRDLSNTLSSIRNTQFAAFVQPVIHGMLNAPLGYTIRDVNLMSNSPGSLSLDFSGNLTLADASSSSLLGQRRSLGNNIFAVGNGLSSSNSMPSNAPVMNSQGQVVGIATITPIQANQIPTNQMQPQMQQQFPAMQHNGGNSFQGNILPAPGVQGMRGGRNF